MLFISYRSLAILSATGLVLLVPQVGCEPPNAYVAPPPPEVTVTRAVKKKMTTYDYFTGTTKAFASVDLRARVKGFLEKINFKPGDTVKENDLLFEIDPRPYQAQVEAAKADLAIKEAQYVRDDAEYRRNAQLYQRNIIAEQDFVKFRAARDGSKAAVDASKATLDEQMLNLGYCDVRAPLSGRISRNQVDLGNLVGDGQATVLATIVKDHPIYAYVSVSERDLLRFRQLVREGKRVDFRKKPISIGLGMANEVGYPHEGQVDYSDPAVDPGTGTVQARGLFANSDSVIFPGLFVRLRVPLLENVEQFLVPEQALGADQSGRFVLVVDEKDVVDQRKVTVGPTVDGMAVIESGLGPDDLVVVNGIQRARPGQKVTPRTVAERSDPSAEKVSPRKQTSARSASETQSKAAGTKTQP
jgi:RND family efflux transporter MFP subunit